MAIRDRPLSTLSIGWNPSRSPKPATYRHRLGSSNASIGPKETAARRRVLDDYGTTWLYKGTREWIRQPSCLRRAVFQRDNPDQFQPPAAVRGAGRALPREDRLTGAGERLGGLERFNEAAQCQPHLATALLMGVLGGKAVAQFGWLFPGYNPQLTRISSTFRGRPGTHHADRTSISRAGRVHTHHHRAALGRMRSPGAPAVPKRRRAPASRLRRQPGGRRSRSKQGTLRSLEAQQSQWTLLAPYCAGL